MKNNTTIAQTLKKGFVKGLLSPLAAVYVGQGAQVPVPPAIKVETGSFATDLEKIGLDFNRAMRDYGEQQSSTRKHVK